MHPSSAPCGMFARASPGGSITRPVPAEQSELNNIADACSQVRTLRHGRMRGCRRRAAAERRTAPGCSAGGLGTKCNLTDDGSDVGGRWSSVSASSWLARRAISPPASRITARMRSISVLSRSLSTRSRSLSDCSPDTCWMSDWSAFTMSWRGWRASSSGLLSAAALVATYVHDHAAGAEVFAGPPKIAVGNARDRLAYHARDRALPQPACDIIACIWRELARQVFGPVAQVVPDAVTKPGRVWPVAAWCHTATLTLLAGLGIRSRARDLAGPAAGPVRDLRRQLRERRPHHHLSRAAPRQPVRACHWPHGHPRTRRPTCHLPEPGSAPAAPGAAACPPREP